jgi:hypothetical protein
MKRGWGIVGVFLMSLVVLWRSYQLVHFPTTDIPPSTFHNTCPLPLHCSLPKHSMPRHYTNPKRFILLASFPGSGNTYLRKVIEDGTRLWTGSFYHDKSLLESGFQGEFQSVFKLTRPKVTMMKLHHPQRIKHNLFPNGVLLLRSPFDAVVAEFHRLHSGLHAGLATEEELRTNFPPFALGKLKEWVKSCDLFLNDSNWDQVKTVAGLKTTNGQLHSIGLRKNETVYNYSQFVLFYEDLVYKFPSTTRQLFEYLEDKLPINATKAHECALHLVHTQGMNIKRNSTLKTFNPWQLLDKEFFIQACLNLTRYWVDEKWGACGAFPTQQERRLVAEPIQQNGGQTCY